MALTERLIREVEKFEDNKDYLEFISRYVEDLVEWGKKYKELKLGKECTDNDISEYCGVNRGTVIGWKNKIPAKRSHVIGIGMFFELDICKINKLLKRYSQYSELYAKDPEDIIYIYLIINRKSFREYENYMEQYNEIVKSKDSGENGKVKKSIGTINLKDELLTIQSDELFHDYIVDKYEYFKSQRESLYKFINDCLTRQGYTLNTLDADGKLKGKFNQLVTKLKVRGIVPRREELLALGINAEMSIEEINTMLELAGMEVLCPKIILDCVLIYLLNDIALKYPSSIYIEKEEALSKDYHEEDDEGKYISNILKENLNRIRLERDDVDRFIKLL